MIGILIALCVIVVVLAAAALVAHGRNGRESVTPDGDGPGGGDAEPTPAPTPQAAAGSEPPDQGPRTEPEPPPRSDERSGRLRQCPRCGRHTVPATGGNVSCSWCGLAWRQPPGEAWPDVHLCLWIPPSDRPPVKEKT